MIEVNIRAHLLGKGQTTNITCEPFPTAFYGCPSDYPKRLLRWEVQLLQDDSWKYDWISIRQHMPSCEHEARSWEDGPFTR